jgi:hypothetical protein
VTGSSNIPLAGGGGLEGWSHRQFCSCNDSLVLSLGGCMTFELYQKKSPAVILHSPCCAQGARFNPDWITACAAEKEQHVNHAKDILQN